MTPSQYTLMAYGVGVVLIWGYALVLFLSGRASRRRRG
jgi:hypothetical protein